MDRVTIARRFGIQVSLISIDHLTHAQEGLACRWLFDWVLAAPVTSALPTDESSEEHPLHRFASLVCTLSLHCQGFSGGLFLNGDDPGCAGHDVPRNHREVKVHILSAVKQPEQIYS